MSGVTAERSLSRELVHTCGHFCQVRPLGIHKCRLSMEGRSLFLVGRKLNASQTFLLKKKHKKNITVSVHAVLSSTLFALSSGRIIKNGLSTCVPRIYFLCAD